MKTKIPLSPPFFGGEEISLVKKVLKSKRVTLGPMLQQFEDEMSKFLGVTHALGVSNGTTGLHMSLIEAGIKSGDEVITTPFSFVSSANSILFVNAKPVFVDIDGKTLNMDSSKIENAITSKTKAILVVHILGQPCDMDPIMKTAEKNNLTIIEDSCESLGAKYNGRFTGTFGRTAVLSFAANKPMTAGEGGMVLTNRDDSYYMIKSLRNQGRPEGNVKSDTWLTYDKLGYNYRLSDVNAAIGLAQLHRLKKNLLIREKLAKNYDSLFKNTGNVITPFTPSYSEPIWFLYVVRFKEGVDRNVVMRHLVDNGIECRPYFPSIHLFPQFKAFGYKDGDMPVSESVSRSSLAIPFYIGMKKSEQETVIREIEKAAG